MFSKYSPELLGKVTHLIKISDAWLVNPGQYLSTSKGRLASSSFTARLTMGVLTKSSEILTRILLAARTLAAAVGAQEFDLILTEGVSYVSDRIDITAQTIEMLKQLSESSEETQ